ncbi:serine hydrolase [Jeotgalibacillus proteolyticus]|uniref:Serine hydrolase n=1 Tax=Jeotgalibacillus proteolyticus TaxID=2082395 RepID=A0A2S5G915_9BACL|nr:serine hydrolase [Jeotgalibacillus proteolyticus]PPA69469.1 serine hydrolase [Jeotgalibacillus proteolyticus]
MKKQFVVLTLCTLLIAPALPAEQPAIGESGKKEMSLMNNQFTWNQPKTSAPVLHPGNAKSAGMIDAPLKEIDPLMEGMISDGVMPGAVAFVARSGHVVKHDAYGFAYQYEDDQYTKAEHPVAMKKDTIFDLASISKIFTVTAAMKLYEEGHFKLDDKVANYIPEFSQNGKEDVTIRQLMTHTSGFAAWIPLYTQGSSREDRLQLVFAEPLVNPPDSTYTYSDLNMITLGALIERLSGKTLDAFVKQTITDPIGMKDTMYNPPAALKPRIAATEYQPAIGRGLVWGEVHDENAWSLDGIAGHAGVFSTAEDLAKFAHMFLMEGRYGGKRILKPETIRTLNENQIPQFPGDDHGLGWELNQGWLMDALTDEDSLGHTGFSGTSIVINQKNDTVAILLTNRVHPSRNTVSTNVARRAFAQLTADAIPVKTAPKSTAWFSGYGDGLQRTLTAELKGDKPALLTFETWHRIEENSDYGFVEVSADGEDWSAALPAYTGNSADWKKESVSIPEGTKFIRFRYQTDASVNGRGWYIQNPRLTQQNGDSVELKLDSDDWTKRKY